jgi:hypothetical protein
MRRHSVLCPVLAWLAFAVSPAVAYDNPVVTISKADCDRLVVHRPAPDVTYQPGVDAKGRTVTPADLDGGVRIAVPDTIRIPIDVDLFDRFGIPANPDLYEADARIGEVVIQNDRAYFNGQPLQDDLAAELAVLCQQAAREDQ